MNYKKIIKNRNTRKHILRVLNFVPDKQMIQLQYKLKVGRKLNLQNPIRYTEKLQWYKLYYRDNIMPQCVEKYNVRDYVNRIGCGELLNECYGVYDDPNQIPFNELPQKFVLKDTLGGGSNEVIVIKDKDKINMEQLKNQLKKWIDTSTQKKHLGREWPYDGQKHRIIVEKFLEEPSGDLIDYKFFCFNGKVRYIYIRSGYANSHEQGKMAFFNRNLEYLKGVGMDYCNISTTIPELADNMQEMIEYADKLSEKFPHVRVDFYNIQGQIIFGELTFFNASGYMKFIPDEFDFEMGKYFILPHKNF